MMSARMPWLKVEQVPLITKAGGYVFTHVHTSTGELVLTDREDEFPSDRLVAQLMLVLQ